MIHERAQEVAPNIKYEFSMLEWSHNKVLDCSENSQDKNGYLECFLLHSRNLVDFFIKPSNYHANSDVIARNFFVDDSVWSSKESTLCKYIVSERDKINKTLAHLTFERINEKTWDVCRIWDDLSEAKSKFLSCLGSGQKPWFN